MTNIYRKQTSEVKELLIARGCVYYWLKRLQIALAGDDDDVIAYSQIMYDRANERVNNAETALIKTNRNYNFKGNRLLNNARTLSTAPVSAVNFSVGFD
jgi:hypothetical protein